MIWKLPLYYTEFSGILSWDIHINVLNFLSYCVHSDFTKEERKSMKQWALKHQWNIELSYIYGLYSNKILAIKATSPLRKDVLSTAYSDITQNCKSYVSLPTLHFILMNYYPRCVCKGMV